MVIEDLSSHPNCDHGPTLLFQRTFNSSNRIDEFYACSACRSRKECSFYLEKANDQSIILSQKERSSQNWSQNTNDQDEALRKVN